jgi:cytochrome c oxidase subunit 2
VLCEELCGVAHFAMRGRVVVDDEPAYQAWLAGQPTYAQTLAQRAGDAAAGKAAFAMCAACHGAGGEGKQALNAPKLAGQSPWYLERQLANFKIGLRGAREDDPIGKQMAAIAASLDEAGIRNVLAYVASLADTGAPATLSGDAIRGKAIYATCAQCHGPAGEGIWTTHAPRLAHMSDWYLARQLDHFRRGIRGGHPQDFQGAQMAFMARTLAHERATEDVLAYIGGLK